MTSAALIRAVAFVVRCSGAATCAHVAASVVGLPHSVWAAITALVVSQEELHETKASVAWRIVGTIVGACVAVAVGLVGSRGATSVSLQIATTVAICATLARQRPALRVSMWTAPIVLLTAQPGEPIAVAAAYRSAEVILGGLIGGAFHWAADALTPSMMSVSSQRSTSVEELNPDSRRE